jgi:hypothetical protein
MKIKTGTQTTIKERPVIMKVQIRMKKMKDSPTGTLAPGITDEA